MKVSDNKFKKFRGRFIMCCNLPVSRQKNASRITAYGVKWTHVALSDLPVLVLYIPWNRLTDRPPSLAPIPVILRDHGRQTRMQICGWKEWASEGGEAAAFVLSLLFFFRRHRRDILGCYVACSASPRQAQRMRVFWMGSSPVMIEIK